MTASTSPRKSINIEVRFDKTLRDSLEAAGMNMPEEKDKIMVKVSPEQLGEFIVKVSSILNIINPTLFFQGPLTPIRDPCECCNGTGKRTPKKQ